MLAQTWAKKGAAARESRAVRSRVLGFRHSNSSSTLLFLPLGTGDLLRLSMSFFLCTPNSCLYQVTNGGASDQSSSRRVPTGPCVLPRHPLRLTEARLQLNLLPTRVTPAALHWGPCGSEAQEQGVNVTHHSSEADPASTGPRGSWALRAAATSSTVPLCCQQLRAGSACESRWPKTRQPWPRLKLTTRQQSSSVRTARPTPGSSRTPPPATSQRSVLRPLLLFNSSAVPRRMISS